MNQFLTKAASVVVAAAFLATPAPAFADHTAKVRDRVKTNIEKVDERRECARLASKTFVLSVRKANADYKTARQAALEEVKAARKGADTKQQKQAAREAFKSELKAARDKMKAAKKAALDSFKTAKSGCKTAQETED